MIHFEAGTNICTRLCIRHVSKHWNFNSLKASNSWSSNVCHRCLLHLNSIANRKRTTWLRTNLKRWNDLIKIGKFLILYWNIIKFSKPALKTWTLQNIHLNILELTKKLINYIFDNLRWLSKLLWMIGNLQNNIETWTTYGTLSKRWFFKGSFLWTESFFEKC